MVLQMSHIMSSQRGAYKYLSTPIARCLFVSREGDILYTLYEVCEGFVYLYCKHCEFILY